MVTHKPLASALALKSPLQVWFCPGLEGVPKKDLEHIEPRLRSAFVESLDVDGALQAGHAQEHRWDYLLGLGAPWVVVALEPHSAKGDQIKTVIAKKKAAQGQLRPHLRPGAKVAAWYWVASGRVQFAQTEKANRLLELAGIKFVGRVLMEKHLSELDKK